MMQTMERLGGVRGHIHGPHATVLNRAIRDAFQVYENRELGGNLKTHGWRKARRRVLGKCALSGAWVRRGGCEVRLTRQGLEVHLPGEETHLIGWQELWDFAQGRGS